MIVDDAFRDLLNATFVPLIAKALEEPVPAPRALTIILEQNAPDDSGTKNLDRDAASHFATAAVDFWLRGVHSFLVSTSLTEASPIWASVSGYYSSHYVVRGFAHLLGYFELFRIRKLAQLTHQNGQYVCSFRDRKKVRGGEHQIYWRLVKAWNNAAIGAPAGPNSRSLQLTEDITSVLGKPFGLMHSVQLCQKARLQGALL